MQYMERRDCIEELMEYVTDIEAIMSLVGQPHLGRAEKARARELLKTLKGKLSADCEAMRSAQSKAEMGAIARAFFQPAAHGTSAALGLIKGNTAPGCNWHGYLHSARLDIVHLLHQLEKQPAEGRTSAI